MIGYPHFAGAFFALSFPDVSASAGWYSRKRGLKVVMEVPRRDGGYVMVLEGGGLIVSGFLVGDFDGAVATLRERGVAIADGPFPARDKQRANPIINDKAGNLIQLLAR